MTNKTAQTRTKPTLATVLQGLKLNILNSLNCVKIGKIISFDGTKKTASVQILFKAVSQTGKITSYPVLADVPVFTPQGGGGAIQAPIAAGDKCIVLFADANIDAWYKSGGEAAPLDARTHDLSDGIALVGINSLVDSLENYATDELKLTYSGAKVSLKSSSLTISLGGAQVVISGGKVAIKNGTTDLKTALDALCTALAAMTTTGGDTISAASATAVNAAKALIDGVLTT